MRTALMFATSLLLLAGCRVDLGSTTITNVSIDGKAQNVMRSHVDGSAGDFECVKSISGQCHYLLFVRECDARAGSTGDACHPHTVEAFTLEAGTSRHLTRLPPRLQQCVSHEATPTAPDCLAARS